VPGIGTAVITVAATADLVQPEADLYASANIPIGDAEIALVDKTRIVVTR
jgi:hypothetical protein